MDRGRLLVIVAIVGTLIRNCQASDDGSTSCNAPSITRVNFESAIEILNGTNRTLSCEIHSDTPLKGGPIWRKDFSELPADLEYIVENASCSDSTSKTCIVSNLTLINAVRFERIILYEDQYTGNYSLTAENNCSNTTVYVGVNILIPQSCVVDYNKPPQLKIAPPSVVQAVEGSSVTITAQYEGSMNDNNLGVYWCVYITQHDYYCYNSTENDDNYTVSIDGCPPDNPNCCYFTVLLKIQSVTRNLTLQSMVVWQQHPHNYIPGNSKLVANLYPTLDKSIPNPNDQCVEVKEGQSIQFTCIYNASTNPNITITTWKFNEELLEHNSSHYTTITQYGSNFNRVLSRITLSNVIPDNAGTYTCQCAYNSKVIVDDKDVVSEAANFCLKVKPGHKVKPGKKQQSFPLLYILFIVVVVVVILVSMAIVILVLFCCWKRQKNKNCDKNCDKNSEKLGEGTASETTPLLSENDTEKQLMNFADNPSINNEQVEPLENNRERSPSGSLIGKKDNTSHLDKLISGQDPHSSVAGLTPSHQKSHRQPGDMVPGTIAGETHEQLPTHSSLESDHASQPVVSKSHIQSDGNSKAADTQKPVISLLSTDKPIESEAEGPRTSQPAAVRPSVSEPVVSQPSNLAVEMVATEVSGYHDRILNLIAPDFTANVNMDALLPYLQQHHLVTRNEEHHLSSKNHSFIEKAQMLLGYLKTKGDESLQRILCCLNLAHEHIGHKGVADKLKQVLKANNIKCADFCSDHSK